MRFAAPAALWLGALALPIIVLHILRPRRQRHTVASTYLWRSMAVPTAAAKPWQRLRPSVLLFLQLAVVALVALAAARPVAPEPTVLADHTVFIVDASASMTARDGSPLRIDDARARTSSRYEDLPAGAIVSVVEADATPTVLASSVADRGSFDGAVASIEASEGAVDWGAAFALAQSLATPDVPIGFVLVSDGDLDPVDLRQVPPSTRYERVGASDTNRAITSLVVETQGSGLHVVATVTNTGGPVSTQTLRFDVDGRTEATEQFVVEGGRSVEIAADLPGGERIEAFLEGEDLLDLDDHAYAVAPRSQAMRVLVTGPRDAFLDALLDSIGQIEVVRADSGVPVDDVDLAIYNQAPVAPGPGVPFLAIAPPGGVAGVTVVGTVEAPAVTLVDTRDPLLTDLDLSAVAIAQAQRVEAPIATVLIGAEGAPLLLRGEADGRRFLYQTYPLAESNLPLQIAFPILGDRILSELGRATIAPAALRVGDRLPLDGTTANEVTRPGGGTIDVPPGATIPPIDRAGFWVVTAGASSSVVAVNPPTGESTLAPADRLPIPEQPLRPRGEAASAATTPRSLLVWFVVPLVLAVMAETVAARRRLGVGRRQWRVALALRGVVAALALLALVDPVVSRPAEQVATMFLLDGSDSVGLAGRSDAVRWVNDAIDAQPDGALAGVAVFGGDARLDATMREALSFSAPSVEVDATRTDLAAALRLAGAVLPSDARRRIVVVSDGRATEGATAAEAERLAADGISVEYHVIGRGRVADTAVTDVEVPAIARDGEIVSITATIESTSAVSAVVSLVRDGAVIGERTVALESGVNSVAFEDRVTGSGLARYQVRVRSPGDSIAENDSGFAATTIEGPATVLLVEGRPGNAATLDAALVAANIVTETVSAEHIPAVDELAGYASIVLVDVDARTLVPEHLRALTTATRDLGRGLVAIGGTQSFGLGGYLGSDLEALLPVVSEILDPLRRQTVAEVFAIDTSGSMGACHCAEGANGMPGGGNSFEGGVNKTDISRAGTAQAIAALSDIDEIGVLAVNTTERWVIDLQQLPAQEVVTSGLRTLAPTGDGTDLSRALTTSADALRDSDASLKHIILFTDGFTDPSNLTGLAADAAALVDEGITVSVVATGEGAARELAAIASAGGGRFYPGRDLQEIPEILAEEAQLASRDFVQEGRFLPRVTAAGGPVAGLDAAPPLLGYVATTAKPTAIASLRLGDDDDPLLSSWQVGLGRATAWTSDLDRWAQTWSTWDGFVDFWAATVKDTFPVGGSGGSVRARVDGDRLTVTVESADTVGDGAVVTARIADPSGAATEVTLTRGQDGTFRGDVAAPASGTYAVGATIEVDGSAVVAGTTLASRSFSDEYRPGAPDETTLASVSAVTGGRGAIEPSASFDAAGLAAGVMRFSLAGMMLVAAALLFPVAVALSRLSVRGSGSRGSGSQGFGSRGSGSQGSGVPAATLGTLLDAQRRRQHGDEDDGTTRRQPRR